MTPQEHRARSEELLVNAYDLPVGSAEETGALGAALVHAVLYVGDQLGIEFDPTAVMDRVVTNIKDHEAARVTRPRNRVEWPPGRGAS